MVAALRTFEIGERVLGGACFIVDRSRFAYPLTVADCVLVCFTDSLVLTWGAIVTTVNAGDTTAGAGEHIDSPNCRNHCLDLPTARTTQKRNVAGALVSHLHHNVAERIWPGASVRGHSARNTTLEQSLNSPTNRTVPSWSVAIPVVRRLEEE